MGGRGPCGPLGAFRSALFQTFSNFTENVHNDGSGWTRRTRGTITPLGGLGVVFHILVMFLEYILRTRTGRMGGRDVYGVTSRMLFTSVFAEGTQLSRCRVVSYGSNVGAGGRYCSVFFWKLMCGLRVT